MLFRSLAKFGAIAAKENIDQVIVGMGPGPFTGLRTGIVFAQSFALLEVCQCMEFVL